MLSRLVAPFSLATYIDLLALAKAVGLDLKEDLSLLRAMARWLGPLPEAAPPSEEIFPPAQPFEVPSLKGKKIGLVATGGGGAMVCALGVVRACEEAGLEITALSSCSGSALFMAPIAAGLGAEESARFVLGWRNKDYLQPDLRALARTTLALGKGFTGLLKGEPLEEILERRLQGVTAGELPIAYYANVWDIDHNRVLYWGSRTRPELRLARIARAAATLPIYVQTLEDNGVQYGDGGAINIFPVDPLVDHHPEIDFYLGVNAFHPANFEGEDASGWHSSVASVLQVSTQSLHCRHLELARQQLRRISQRCLLLNPLPYDEVKGAKLYEHFIDRSNWVRFIRMGYEDARRQLQSLS